MQAELQRAEASAEESAALSRHLQMASREVAHARLRVLLSSMGREGARRALSRWRGTACALTAARGIEAAMQRAALVEQTARLQLMQQAMNFQEKLQLLEHEVGAGA